MITAFRNYAQSWVIKALLIVIVITFVVGFGVGSFSNPREILVKVGDRDISVQTYQQAYARSLANIAQNYEGDVEELARRWNWRQRVYDQLVERELLVQGAQDLALAVSNTAVRTVVREQAAFQQDGAFDYDTYRRVLNLNRMNPAVYEENVRQDLLVEQLREHLQAGVIVTAQEIEARLQQADERAEVSYLQVLGKNFEPRVQPPQAELEAYYKEHKGRYETPRQYKVQFFILKRRDLEDDSIMPAERAITRYYERYLETRFTEQEQVRARHILKRLDADASPEQIFAARDALQKLRDELLQKQDEQGTHFAKLAKRHSDDSSNASKGGDLGFFDRAAMVPPFSDAAFALKQPGELSEVVRTDFGFHLIRLEGQRERSVKALEDVRAEIITDLQKARGERRLTRALTDISSRLAQEDITALAAEYEAELETSKWFDAESTLFKLANTRALYQKIGRSGKIGDVGALERNPLQGHVFYRVVEVQERSQKPLEEVTVSVARAVKQAAGVAAAKEAAEQALTQLKAGKTSLDAFAKKHKLELQKTRFTASASQLEGLGSNTDFQRLAFELDEAQPYGLSIRRDDVYLLRFHKRLPPEDNTPARKQALSDEIKRTWTEFFFAEQLAALRQRYPVQLEIPGLITAQ